jgi:hypothetical protein
MRSAKEPILKAHGYVYNFDRMVYYNRTARKAFSVEWVEDHTEDELTQALAVPSAPDTWQFFSTGSLSKSVVDNFLAELSA